MRSRILRKACFALIFLLTACAQLSAPQKPAGPATAPQLTAADAQALYKLGLGLYADNQFDLSLSDLQASVDSGFLKLPETVNARKTMAFIYCVTKREAQCREQFQVVLKLDPGFTLQPNEAEHPLWGPVWLSVKGVHEDQKAVTRGEEVKASKGQQKLADGIKEYDAGHFKEAIATLQAALESGLTDKSDQIRAHKYAAFSNCLLSHKTPCRAEFHAIFALEPKFELLPSEVGHPAWSAAYRAELALARKAQAAKSK